MKKELELYLHIPFCIRKCEYCDFLSEPADEKSRRVYLDAMLRELAAVGNLRQKNMKLYLFILAVVRPLFFRGTGWRN